MTRYLILLGALIAWSYAASAADNEITLTMPNQQSWVYDADTQAWKVLDSNERHDRRVEADPFKRVTPEQRDRIDTYHQTFYSNCEPFLPNKSFEVAEREELNYVIINPVLDVMTASKGKFGTLIANNKTVSVHCALGVYHTEVSPGKKYVVFVENEIDDVHFLTPEKGVWFADYTGDFLLHIYNLETLDYTLKRYDEEIRVIKIDDQGLMFLIARDASTRIRSPLDLLGAIAGHPPTVTRIDLWRDDSSKSGKKIQLAWPDGLDVSDSTVKYELKLEWLGKSH